MKRAVTSALRRTLVGTGHDGADGDHDLPSRVLLRFAVVCALALALAGGAILWFVRADARTAAERNESLHTQYVADTILRDNLTASDVVAPPSGARLDDIDLLFQREVVVDDTVRGTLYSRVGLAVYSNDHTLIGTHADSSSDLDKVFAGTVVQHVARLNHAGGTGKDIKVLESYVPFRLPGSPRVVAVFELSSDYRPVSAEVSRVGRNVSVAIVVALLVLYLALFPILRRVTGALARRNRGLAERTRELTEALRQLRDSQEEVASSREETIRRLSVAAEYRDPDTGRHIERMSRFAAVLARELGLDAKTVELIRTAAALHDVGKIATPDAILLKPGALTPAERKVMQEHARLGFEMLDGSQSELLQLAATIAQTHHEKVDGTGYPEGLRGEEIPLVGRIAAVADVFDALTSDRVYRPALTIEEALEIMRAGRGSHFDERVFGVFEGCLDELIAIRGRLQREPAPV